MTALMPFQQRTADRAFARLFTDPDRVDRFLVADEVGLGKTHIAEEVIRKAVRFWDEGTDVERIDVVYICANQTIARQNIAKLMEALPNADRVTKITTRLTELATQNARLNTSPACGSKKVNFIALTPGTSFAVHGGTGTATERAILAKLIIECIELTASDMRVLHTAFAYGVQQDGFDWRVENLTKYDDDGEPIGLDAGIVDRFAAEFVGSDDEKLLREFLNAMHRRHRGTILAAARDEYGIGSLIGRLRKLLANVSMEALEPDLVILDEFQRFADVFHSDEDLDDETKNSDSRELARLLVEYPNVKTLVLSATPYRMYAKHGEGESYQDFLATVRFLYGRSDTAVIEGRRGAPIADLRAHLAALRTALTADTIDVDVASDAARNVETLLTSVIARTERPPSGDDDLIVEQPMPDELPTAEELVEYVVLRRLAKEAGSQMGVDYWKSIPFFGTFGDDYALGRTIASLRKRGRRDDLEACQSLAHVRVVPEPKHGRESAWVDAASFEYGHPRVRALAAATIEADMWKFLWLPPSLPYTPPGGVFAQPGVERLTKRLVFSSWNSTPAAVSALLSGAAHHAMNADGVRGDRLRADDESAPGTNLLFSFNQRLAEATDPLHITAARYDAASSLPSDLMESVRSLLDVAEAAEDGRPWTASDPRDVGVLLAGGPASDSVTPTAGDLALVSRIGTAGPAYVAWRALRRLAGPEVSDRVVEASAAKIADGLRSLFNRGDSTALLDSLYPEKSDGGPAWPHYWQRVLQYCIDGNLQAVLDEYLSQFAVAASDEKLTEYATKLADAVSIHEGSVSGHDLPTGRARTFPTRFALRFGGEVTSSTAEGSRTDVVRDAFNSPFWPMVLTSTSVGQEGIDFHQWCHALVHWNLPTNPVDFEQREGRVNRFRGHAVRKNVAVAFGAEAFRRVARGEHASVWAAAFAAAAEAVAVDPSSADGIDGLLPSWVYRGRHKIERHISALPMTTDRAKAAALQRERVLYRMAFAQPRQQDLVEALAAHDLDGDVIEKLRINLRP